MNWLSRWARTVPLRLRSILRRNKVEQELEEEFQFHRQRQIEEHIANGMKPEEARYAALRTAGSVELHKEQCRDARGFVLIETIIQDVRYALRQMRKNPTFAAVAVITLALCIGANTAIFSVVDATVLRPLSYRDGQELVAINEVAQPLGSAPVSARHFLEWRRNAHSFESIALIQGFNANLTDSYEPERIAVGRVSPALFGMLGVQAQLGRTFLDSESEAGRGQVVILEDGVWRGRFGADRSVIGHSLKLDGTSYEIIGVLPPGFHFPKISEIYALPVNADRPKVWIPFVVQPEETRLPVGQFNFACIARLKTGVSVFQATSELDGIEKIFGDQVEPPVDLTARVVPLQGQMVSRSRSALELILAAVGIVLLIGCLNVANLLLSRISSRQREMALRAAIGATRARLTRQVLIEGLALSLLGTISGVFLAHIAIPLVLAAAPGDIPRLDEVQIDKRVLLFSIAISVFAGVFIGIVPALRSQRKELHVEIGSGSRTSANRNSTRMRFVLVTAEVALAAMCLICGGLLLHSFVNILNVDAGFKSQHILTVDLNFGRGKNTLYPNLAKRAAFVKSALDRLQVIPGVTSVSFINTLPLTGVGENDAIFVDGQNLPLFERPIAAVKDVSSGYFQALGIALNSGRLFEESDRNRHAVAVISASTAKRVWPKENPIGKQFHFLLSKPIEVIGVVNDTRETSLEGNPENSVYLPYWQQNSSYLNVSFAIKTVVDPPVMSQTIRNAFRELDPELPLSEFRTMDDIVTGSVSQRRFQMNLVLLFALASILLASLGIYGVTSYTVTQKTNEIGIHMALGADRRLVIRTVLYDVLRFVAAGLAVGLPLAIAAASLLRSLLFGVSPGDWITFLSVPAMIVIASVAAAYFPAHRAASIDPMVALRSE